jgi:hypothetical protein
MFKTKKKNNPLPYNLQPRQVQSDSNLVLTTNQLKLARTLNKVLDIRSPVPRKTLPQVPNTIIPLLPQVVPRTNLKRKK